MRVSDVTHLTLADVLQRVDPVQATMIFRELEGIQPLPNELTPWPHENSPIGTWKLDPVFGTFEVLVWIDPWEVEISEGNHEDARGLTSSALYRQWLSEGLMPPAITVVRHCKGYPNSLNRRRTLAARDTNTPFIPAWFSETTPSGAAR